MDPSAVVSDEPAPTRTAGKKWKAALRLIILLIVAVALGHHVYTASLELREHPIEVEWNWIALSVACYLLGLFLLGIPWWICLGQVNVRLPLFRSLRIYVISHSGKYVPGKAMVLVIRCGLLADERVPVSLSAATTLYETFVNMAGGALLALACLTLLPAPPAFTRQLERDPWIVWGACALAAGLLAVVSPPVFQFVSKVLSSPIKSPPAELRRRLPWTATLRMLVSGLFAWPLLGLSYFFSIQAVTGGMLGLDGIPMAIATATLSVVGGILSMVPGHIGVREWIQIESLLPVVGEDRYAVAASLAYRAVTLFTELGIAAILYFGGKR